MSATPRQVIFGTGAIGLATLEALRRRGEREQRRPHRHERAVERQAAGGAARASEHPALRRGHGDGVLELPEAGLGPRDVDERGLGLDEQHEHRDEQPQRRPAVDRVPAAVGADPQRDRQRRLGEVVPEPVEVHADGRHRAAPARQLAVGAVQQQLKLDEHDGRKHGRDPRQRQRQRREQAAGDHQPGHGVGRQRRAQQRARQVRRHAAHVQPPGPVLAAVAREQARRLRRRPQLSDRRRRRRHGRSFARPPRRGSGARAPCNGPDAWPARAARRSRTAPRRGRDRPASAAARGGRGSR